MRKRDLANAVASHTDTDPRTVTKVIDGTVEVIMATVAKGEDVAISGFAKFSKVKRAARTARNPATGEPVKVKASTKARITPLKGFKDVVLGNTPAPKLAKAAPAKKTTATTTRGAAKAPAAKSTATTRTTGAKAAPAKASATKAASASKAAGTKAAPARAAKR